MLFNLVPEKSRKLLSDWVFDNFEILCSSCSTDPLIHHGRHFGRTVHALCSVSALLNNGILRMGELADEPEESFTHDYLSSYRAAITVKKTHRITLRERREHCVFTHLLQMIPELEERLMSGSDEEVLHVAELVSLVYL